MALLGTLAHKCGKRGSKNLSGLWAVVSVLLLAGGLESPAQAAPPAEYQLKAIFLFNFAQFVEWPLKPFPKQRRR